MLLLRPLMASLKMTVRDDCAVYKSYCPLPAGVWGGRGLCVSLWTNVCHTHTQTIAVSCNRANFPFPQTGLFTGFWVWAVGPHILLWQQFFLRWKKATGRFYPQHKNNCNSGVLAFILMKITESNVTSFIFTQKGLFKMVKLAKKLTAYLINL